MVKRILKMTLVFLLAACTSNTIYQKPEDLIPKSQMIDLLTDLYLANSANNNPNKLGERNIKYFPLVYEKYKIDSSRFKRSNYYYTSKIKEYQSIKQAVFNNLKTLKKEHDVLFKKSDSLAKIKREAVRKINLKKRKHIQK
ncbi:MAG: DUF4296 domain-containing protein [Flavobacteriaceae bacterium]|nr:DUF4296 domain-containing protein [Flavobacteriaceae bacterium]